MFVELHARSAFSFLASAAAPEDLIDAAVSSGMPAMALVDIDNLCGAPRFFMAAKKAGIRAHVGAEITPASGGGRYVLLAENQAGYQNLCRLITSMKLRAKKGEGSATEAEFREHAQGLVAITRGDQPAELLLDIYGRGNVYAELRRHFDRDEEERNLDVLALAERHNLPVIASNNPVYAGPGKRELFDVFTCIRNKTSIADAGRLLSKNGERWVKAAGGDGAAVRRPSRGDRQHGGAVRAARFHAGQSRLPLSAVSRVRRRNDELVPAQAHRGRRAEPFPQLRRAHAGRQIDRELALIEKLDLAGYFLIVWDIVQFCRREDILAQGRGSAANSARMLLAGHHGRRPHQARPAVRAIPVGRARPSGRTSTSTCRAANSASASYSTSTSATASAARP